MELKRTTVAVVGATGAVGMEMLRVLAERGVPKSQVRALASARSAGRCLPYADSTLTVSEVAAGMFEGCGVVLLAAGSDAAKTWAHTALGAGADVIDNSSAFRMDPRVPLVIPEVNAGVLPDASSGPRLISNPNCTAIIMLMAVTPLYRRFGCRRLVVSTYQGVSGAGAAAMDELTSQTRAVLAGAEPEPGVFSEVCAFNVFSHDSEVDPETGRNREEEKLIRETKKIWDDDAVEITATCVRVPVLRAHTESINITLATPATEREVRSSLAEASGVVIEDDRTGNRFPTPLKSSGRDQVFVGRVRPDAGAPLDNEGRTDRFDLICCGDQLRKGAALNAVQIAEALEGRRG